MSVSVSDAEGRLMQKKIRVVDTHFNAMATSLEDILRTESKLADRWDAFATQLEMYSEEETSGIRDATADYADMLKAIQQSRRRMYEQLDHRVYKVLRSYPAKLKGIREDIHAREKIKHKEHSKKKHYDRLKARDPGNDSGIKKAKVDLAGARSEVKQAEQTLLQSMLDLQQEKMNELREMFTDMMEAQMIFMCRGLEELSTGQKSLDIINAEEDLADIRELIGDESAPPVFEDEHKEHTRNADKRRIGHADSVESVTESVSEVPSRSRRH